MADLDQLRAMDNLQRAWRWVRSSSDSTYKSYFRHLYGNYAVADAALLSDLAARLKRGVYQPSKACKLFFPKASGILRPYSLLTVEDQIVYQAAANLIAEKLFPKVKDSSHDVALAAGWKTFVDDVAVPCQKRQLNPSGAILLKELGVIKRKTAGYCGIDHALKKLNPKIPSVNWKKFMGKNYAQAEKQAIEVAALSGTNITAFVNALDVFNELYLDSLFTADGAIGGYTLGKIGSALAPTSRFAVKYPAVYALAKEVHDARYLSMYSHPRVGKTAKPTKKISYRFLGEARSLLKAAVSELKATGF